MLKSTSSLDVALLIGFLAPLTEPVTGAIVFSTIEHVRILQAPNIPSRGSTNKAPDAACTALSSSRRRTPAAPHTGLPRGLPRGRRPRPRKHHPLEQQQRPTQQQGQPLLPEAQPTQRHLRRLCSAKHNLSDRSSKHRISSMHIVNGAQHQICAAEYKSQLSCSICHCGWTMSYRH